jgi:hypothetical protein
MFAIKRFLVYSTVAYKANAKALEPFDTVNEPDVGDVTKVSKFKPMSNEIIKIRPTYRPTFTSTKTTKFNSFLLAFINELVYML